VQTFYVIFGILVSVIAVVVRVFFWNSGRMKERLKNTEKANDALVEEINRLNSLPRNDTDRFKLWAERIKQAKDREKSQ
jgi:ABC-type phosphate transport system auxiliary subunit